MIPISLVCFIKRNCWEMDVAVVFSFFWNMVVLYEIRIIIWSTFNPKEMVFLLQENWPGEIILTFYAILFIWNHVLFFSSTYSCFSFGRTNYGNYGLVNSVAYLTAFNMYTVASRECFRKRCQSVLKGWITLGAFNVFTMLY